MSPIVNNSHHGEHEGGHDAVGEHLQHPAGHPHRMQGGYAHQDVAHVADAGISDDVFQVSLRHGGYSAVEHVDGAQDDQYRHPGGGALRQQHNPNPDDTVGSQLHQNPGVQHANPGGGRHVAVGRPGVKGPQTGQNSKADHEQREHPVLESLAEMPLLSQLTQKFQ